MRNHLIGLVACAAAIALGIWITSLFATPEPPPLPPPPPPPAAAVTGRLTQVVFNPETQRVSATVELRSAETPPERVSVRLYLQPELSNAGANAEPVDVAWPAGGSRTATVEVSTACYGVSDTSSLYAYVAISPDGKLSERAPVLVAEGSRRGR